MAAGAAKITRRAVHTFLRRYDCFALVAALLALPASASVLLSQAAALSHPRFLETVRSTFLSLFEAAGFPVSSDELFFTATLTVKFSQAVLSFAWTLPFALTSVLLAKATVINAVCRCREGAQELLLSSSPLHLYRSLLQTQLCTYFATLSVNAAVLAAMFVAFNAADASHVSTPNTILLLIFTAGAILYSIAVTHAVATCNLALVIAGVENHGGFLPLMKAFLLVRRRAPTALSIALLANLGTAAVEALFQYRVVKPYHMSGKLHCSQMGEAFLLAYIHSLVVIMDIVAISVFFNSFNLDSLPSSSSGDGGEKKKKKQLWEMEEFTLESSKCQESQ